MSHSNGAEKRGADSAFDIDNLTKKLKTEEGAKEESQGITLPLRDVPYHEQLEKKQLEVENLFKSFSNIFQKTYPQFIKWYRNVYLETRLRIDSILKSPKTNGYRNKCELTIGFNPEQGKLCAGPRIANGEDGKVQVGSCSEDLIHLPTSMIQIAQDFSNFLDKWNYLEEKCPWFNLFIRTAKNGDHMLIVIVREDSHETLLERKNELIKYYTDDYQLPHKVASIFIQPRKEDCEKKSFELDFLHVHGEHHLIEKLLDIELLVTPGIFFRINTYAAEVLFQKTIDASDLKRKATLVIDLWCGCGELSLLAARRANYVIGIDPSKWNVRKAQAMARHNRIRNLEFIIAKPEEGLKQIWSRLPMAEEIVIIADPPTLCKMYQLGEMLTEMTNVKRFLYLYSTHKLNLVKNLMSLSDSSFLPTRIIPVDVSPHNVRLEMIISLKRVDPYEKPLLPERAPVTPSADWIEEIERRAFAMGMAKAMATASPTPAIPPLLPEERYTPRRNDGFDDIAVRDRFRGGPPVRGDFDFPDSRDGFDSPRAKLGVQSGRASFGNSAAKSSRGKGTPSPARTARGPPGGFGTSADREFYGGQSGFSDRDAYTTPRSKFAAGGAGYGEGYDFERRTTPARGGGYGADTSFGSRSRGYDEYEEYGSTFGNTPKGGRGASTLGGFGRSGFSINAGSDFSSGGFRSGNGGSATSRGRFSGGRGRR